VATEVEHERDELGIGIGGFPEVAEPGWNGKGSGTSRRAEIELRAGDEVGKVLYGSCSDGGISGCHGSVEFPLELCLCLRDIRVSVRCFSVKKDIDGVSSSN